MSIVEFLSQPLWQRLGLTLVHFLWQGLAVAVLAGAFVKVFRLKHGNARYGAYLLAFIAMIACPVVTFTAIDISLSPDTELVTGAESTEVVETFSYAALPAGDILPEAEIPRPAIPTLADSIPLGQRISDWLNVSMPWVLVIWMVGVIVLSVRLLMGFVGVYRWRHHLEPLPERLVQRIVSLSEGLGMRMFSRVFISPTVLQAMAVGYLRPMVLLPAAMVTQMQPEMLEAVIAHELAHIRRFDLWVNLIQRVTETLLFYHPAVWWLSICLRSERELCCDELAVKATGQRLAYATTLESVGRAGFMAKPPILAAGLGQDNKPTLSRVRHILGLTPTQRNCPFWLAGVITVLFLAALVIPTTLALTSRTNELAEMQEKKNEKELSKFKTTLPNGVTIELVGICEYPSAGKQWWRPDGSSIEADEFRDYDFDDAIVPEDNQFLRLLALRFDDDVLQNIRFSWVLKDARESRFEPDYTDKERKRLRPIQVIEAAFPKAVQSTNLQLGVATGPWKSVAAGAPATRGAHTLDSITQGDVIYHEASEDNGYIHISATHILGGDYDCRIVAKGKDGKVYEPSKYSNSGREMRLCKSEFDIPLEQVKWFYLQARPFQWVTFKNVSLRPGIKTDVQGKSQHIDVETLLNKVRQAQRPTENMIVEWQSEKPQPLFAVAPRSLKPGFSPPSRILQTYKAIIAGDKSRIEERELTFQSQKDTEPSRIREITYVFDGTMQKQLDHFVKGFENEYRGYRHTYDKNTQLLLKLLLAYPPYLDSPELQEKYNLKVIENKEKGLIILETSKENSGIHRFTIDPDKDYNIVKQDVILPRGTDYEINCIVKKQANGLWYQVAREKIRYSVKTGKPFLENKVKITKLDFNPEIPTGAFELQFPKGIKIWDGSLKDWIIVGDEEETSREPAVQVEGGGSTRSKAQLIKPEIIKTSDGRAKLMYSGRYVYCQDLAKLVAEKIGFITDKNITLNDGKNQISIVCPTTEDALRVLKFLQAVDLEPLHVKIDLLVVETYPDVELDWETRVEAKNITRTMTTSNAKPGKSLSVPDILRETVKTEPQPENSIEKLIDLLTSRGYLKILMNPTLEVVNGKTAKIRSSSREPTGKEFTDSFEVTPRILDDGNIDVATKMVFQNKQMSDPRTHINIKDSGSLVIGSVTKTEKRDIVRDGVKGSEERTTEVLVILTPTIITPEMNLSKKPDLPVKKQEEKDQKELSKFRTTLPNGVTIELVGICEYPSAGKQWWRPDGTPFTLPAGIKVEDRISRVDDNAYQFLFRYNSQEDLMWNSLDAVCLHFSIEGDSGVSLINMRRLPKDGQDGLVSKVAIFKEPLDSTTIQANLATGNWQTKAIRDISKIDQRSEELYWFTSKSAGRTKVDILHRIEGQQIKTIAIDREGNEYRASYSLGSFNGTASISNIEGRRYHASVRKDDRLVKFKLQSRPFWSSVIGNVSLRPNFKPAVQVEVEGAEAVSGKSEVGSVSVIRAVDNKATLAGGLDVELLGLTYQPIKDQPWWRPDGLALQQPLFDRVDGDPTANPLWEQFNFYAIAYRLSAKSDEDIRTKWIMDEIVYVGEDKQWAKMMSRFIGDTNAYIGQTRVKHIRVASAAQIPKSAQTATLRLGVADGRWRTLLAGSHYGFYRKGDDSIIVGEPFSGGPGGVFPGEKGLHIGVTYNITDRDFRVLAVDKDGKVHLSTRSGSSGTDNLRKTTASFPDLNRDELQEYRFQVRGWEWVEFKDISLRPGKEAVALAEQRRAIRQKELEKWLGQGQTRQIRQLILLLRECYLDNIGDTSLTQVETMSAMKELVRIGKPAVPELIAELRRTENRMAKGLIAFVLRAIGDPKAVPVLIEVLGQSRYRGEFGIFVKDEDLAKFMLDNQHCLADESDRQAKSMRLGCPVIEITKALEKITGHSEGPERFSPEAAGVVKSRWHKWWEDNEKKTDVQVEKEKRPLHFPDKFSVGTLYIRDPITDDWYKNWEKHGEANGEISVPARKQVKLVISEPAAGDLSFLSELGANDIQMLSFGWKAVTLGSLAPIGNLKGLNALNLQSTRFEYEDLKYLTKLDELEILRLGDYELTDESMRYIGELTSLRSLALWGTGISEEGLIHLQNLKNLTFLALNSCDITDSGLSYLKNMTNLEGLQLTKTGITGNGLSSLSHLTKLKSLLIGHNNITDEGLEKLQSLTLLENLWINNTLITDDGLAYLSDMKNLKELYASNTKISDAGLVHLKGLKDFWHLSITGIGDKGISHLSELPTLKHLQIHDAQVTKASIRYFQKMESIEKVLLSGEKINNDLLEALRAALPACNIWDPQRSRDYPMPAWRKKFEEVYRLEDNRILKRIAPPFIPERRDYYVNEHSNQASIISRSPDRFIFHWNGKLKNWGLGFTNKLGLGSILGNVFRLKSFEYDGPEELLSIELPGDWIIRDEVTQKVKLKALEQLIAEELSRTIQFEKRTVERQVIVATGSFKFHPLPAADNSNRVYMFSDKFEPNAGGGGGTADSVAEFLGALGNRVGVPVIDETDASKEMKIVYHHHRSAYLSKLTNIEEKAKKLEMLLANLTQQTELQFRIQKRPVGVWFITEKKKDK